MPPASRKVSSPDSREMPAPVRTTIASDGFRSLTALPAMLRNTSPAAPTALTGADCTATVAARRAGGEPRRPRWCAEDRRRRMYSILFVCTGNICRSPTAEQVTRVLLERRGLAGVVEVDSAGDRK